LGIPHYAFDRRELFLREVVDPFVDAYLAGSTPSPCVSCNRAVKMSELFAIADRLGAAKGATGHYARPVTPGDRGRPHPGAGRATVKKNRATFSTRSRKLSSSGSSCPSGTPPKPRCAAMRRGAACLAPPRGKVRSSASSPRVGTTRSSKSERRGERGRARFST